MFILLLITNVFFTRPTLANILLKGEKVNILGFGSQETKIGILHGYLISFIIQPPESVKTIPVHSYRKQPKVWGTGCGLLTTVLDYKFYICLLVAGILSGPF